MRSNKKREIKAIFKRDGFITVDQLCRELDIKEPMTRRYLGELKARSSVNCNGRYYILPEYFEFNENGLLYLKDVAFFKHGNQQDAVCHLIDRSIAGLTPSELSESLKSKIHTILPKMFRSGKIVRQKVSGVRELVYISSEPRQQKRQLKARRKSLLPDQKEICCNDEFDAEAAFDILVTMIKKPDLTAKGIALSLQRRGRKITHDKVKEVVQHFDISKKNF